jgi:signal transduction histidine kinase
MRSGASLSRRLLTAAAAFIAIAMIVATVLISFVLHRFITGQIDLRLDSQIVFVTSLLHVEPDGRISLSANADGPPFERVRRGWYWEVVGPRNSIRSMSLDGSSLNDAPAVRDMRPPPPKKDAKKAEGRPVPADGIGPEEERLHFRIKQVDISGKTITIITSAPRTSVLGPLWEAITTLGISLGALALALIGAMFFQVRLGLRPLDRLRRSLADIRSGSTERIPVEQPAEIQPLVEEMNALLDQNSASLERARRHVANLAHGLKTPLATLAVVATSDKRDPVVLQTLADQMERRIRHHLARARVAALTGPLRARTAIRERLGDLSETMTKIHSDKHVASSVAVPNQLMVACESQDFDEIAGNLLDNAFKWARSAVRVTASQMAGSVAVIIEDDGPGLSPEQQETVLQPGRRLDEAMPGFGFGLSIATELAELYGGGVLLKSSPAGGLQAVITLPAG